jgi:type IV pilus assembly protein PilY1
MEIEIMIRFFTQTTKCALISMALAWGVVLGVHMAGADPWTAPVMSDYIKTPPFTSYSVKPNIMIVLDNSGSMNETAYSDDYNGEPYNSVADSIYEVGDATSAQDDMEENLAGVLRDGTAGANDLDFGTDYVGIRFQNVPIAQGATIEGAYIQFTANGSTSGTSDLVIHGEAADDANLMDVGESYNISGRGTPASRTFTTASASWSPADWTDGEVYTTVDISEIVQEIVDRSGWTTGNAMFFRIAGTGFPTTATGHRQAHSRENGQTLGPILRILVKGQEATRYYGYYNPDYFYTYSSNVFYPTYKKVSYNFTNNSWSVTSLGGAASVIDDTVIAPAVAANGLWDGNWLNWCAMRRVDVLRKVLMGGKATSRQGGGNSQLLGEDPSGWAYYKYFNTSGEGPAVSPYNGNYRYYLQDADIKARTVSSSTNLATYDIKIEKDYATDPDDFYLGNLAGILQRIGDRARWGNMWFENGTTVSGGTIQNTIDDGNISNMVSNLENKACTTNTPLAETFYVAMQHFRQQDCASGLGYATGAAKNNNKTQDPYYDNTEKRFVECAKSFVLLLTDGESTSDSKIPNTYKDYDGDGNDASSCGDCGTDYLDDLALFARTNDLRPGAYTGNVGTGLEGDQNLYLYTVFAFDDSPVARQLLKDAARNGGFDDLNDNGKPDGDYSDPPEDRVEWDKNGDGIPDTYYEASDGYTLTEQLLQAINDILARASSGTAASVISNSRTGEGAVYQSIFYPATTVGGNTANWVGQVQSLMVDSHGNMREDTNGNHRLDLYDDLFIVFTEEEDYPVKKCRDADEDSILDDAEFNNPVEEGKIEDVQFLWTSSQWLNEITNTDITQQRTYGSTDAKRYIFTFVDKDGDMVADSGETMDFVATTTPSWAQANDPNSFYAYIYPYDPFTPPIDASNPDFQNMVTHQVARTVNFIRGQDQQFETVGSTLLPAFRSRQIDYDHDGNVETWRMGDIIYSTPTLVATPAENFDLIYRDGDYSTFYRQYRKRRNVIYAGANDGMLHAINGGFFNDKDKSFIKQPLDENDNPDPNYHAFDLGEELWAYVPYNLLPHLHWLTDPHYGHVYYCDLQPRIFDARIFAEDADHPKGWGTVLVGGMRFGGGRIAADIEKDNGAYDANVDKSMSSAFFVLDITNPEKAPTLLGEINFPRLGFTTCHPGVIPMRNFDVETGTEGDNQWYLIFGSGPFEADGAFTTALLDGTSTQKGVMYAIDLVQLAQNKKVVTLTSGGTKDYPGSGAPYYLAEFAENNSSVSKPIAVDWDLDFNTDAVYFGTSFGDHTSGWAGKMRRIVTNSLDPTSWVTNSTLIDLTNAHDGQPIMAPATAGVDTMGNRWLFFGTGRYYSLKDAENTDQQSYYGIKEPYTVNNGEMEFDYSSTVPLGDLMDVTNIEVYENGLYLANYSGDFNALTNDIEGSYQGWRMDFTYDAQRERNLGQAVLAGDVLTFTSFLPSIELCDIGGQSEVYALYYRTGTAYKKPILGVDISTVHDGNALVLKRGDLGKGMTITPNIHISPDGGDPTSEALFQTSTGAIKALRQQNPGVIKSGKMSWEPDTQCP